MRSKISGLVLAASLMVSAMIPVTADAGIIESEPNNSRKAAEELALADKVLGVMNDADDVDYYKIKVEKAGKYKIYFSHETGEDTGDGWNVEVMNAKGKTFKNGLENSIEISKSFHVNLKKNQTIYIKVTTDEDKVLSQPYMVKVVKE